MFFLGCCFCCCCCCCSVVCCFTRCGWPLVFLLENERQSERVREREREKRCLIFAILHATCSDQHDICLDHLISFLLLSENEKIGGRLPTYEPTYLRWMCMPKQKFELWNVSIKNISIYLLCVRCNVLA